MRRCEKCSLTFPDSAKICRSCGAILDDVVDEPSTLSQSSGYQREQLESIAQQVLSGPDHSPADQSGEQYFWTCSQCSEKVPGSFDICWNCGTDRNGTPGPRSFEAATDSEPEPGLPPIAIENAASGRTHICKLCGSTKVVPNVAVMDQGKYSSGNLQLVVYGSPEAIIFKDSRWGEITADICGECGHVQLRVENAKELYDHYLNSIG
jgi:rRNA maturation endonuclease Nob1